MKSLFSHSLSSLLFVTLLISGCQEKQSQEPVEEEQFTNELSIEPEAYFDFWLGGWEVS